MGGNSFTDQILENIKTFFGAKQNEKDAEKYAKVLENLSFPEMEDCDMERLFDMAKEALSKKPQAVRAREYASCLAVTGLGRGKTKEGSLGDLEAQLGKLAVRMANTLAAYEEDIALDVFQDGAPGRLHPCVAISGTAGSGAALTSMMRSVYGSVSAEPVALPLPHEKTIYATVRINDADKKPGRTGAEKEDGKECASWITAVILSLPAGERYHVRVRLVPLGCDDAGVEERIEKLEELYDKVQFYAETNWNAATSLGSNYSRRENLGEQVVDAVSLKNMRQGREDISSSYGCSLGMARSRKDKRAEHFMKELDREIGRLRRAQTTMVWQAHIFVSAQDEDALQAAACAMSGALKPAGMELLWGEQPVAALTAGTAEMLPLLFFPTKEFPGFAFSQNEEFSLTSPASCGEGPRMGSILWNGMAVSEFFLPERTLNRHAFICGMTGAGKTNTVFKIMEETALPYLVIEPVKGEYRSLREKNPDLEVWTFKAGGRMSDSVHVMRINPFWFPENGNLAFHVDSIKTIIASAFEMSAAMPNILEQCLTRVYVKTGWDFVTNRNIYRGQVPEEFLYPTFSDLQREIDDYLDHAEFGDEVLGNYRGAMSTRMKSFIHGFKGLLLNTKEHPDYGKLMDGCNIIELEGLADDADKCLVMGTVLVQYFEYLKLHFQDTGKRLSHITVIEEAHRLFKNVRKKENTENGSDAAGQLVDSLSNIMAEIRAFGEGLLVVDQSPTKIAEDVIKNSGTKLIHRIDNGEDIRVMQASLLLGDDRLSLPALRQGEALVRTEGMTRPCKVKIACSEIKEAYFLSSSFQAEGADDGELGVIFAATAILEDAEVRREAGRCLGRFLLSLNRSGLEYWYADTEHFMLELIGVLRKQRKYDMVDSRLAVMFEIASQTVKAVREGLSVRELGKLHLFVMRVLALYKERREGYFVKDAAIHLLSQYMDREIVPEILPFLEEECGGEVLRDAW